MSTAGNKYSCVLCKRESFTNNLTRHFKKCERDDLQPVNQTNIERFDNKCIFCKRDFLSLRNTRHHENFCGKNPNRRDGHKSNQYIKAKQLGLPKLVCSEETKSKIRDKNLGKNSWWFWKENIDEIRKNHSESMHNAILNNPEAYTSSNRGRVKCIEKDGIKFHGSWEVIFYDWCILNNIKIIRENFTSFSYFWNDSVHQYFPDFFLPELNSYVEVKGYETERDNAKWSQFPQKLIIIKKDEIDRIKANLFNFNKK